MTPGLHYNIPAKDYHADCCHVPSLSSTIARKILSESLVHAHLAHPKLGGADKQQTDAFALGGIVHSLMDDNPEKDWELGPFDSYKSGEARAWRDRTSLSGKSPVLERDLVEARPIVDALKSKVHLPECKSEVTAIWQEGDVWCRARFDKLSLGLRNFWDWKTSSSDMSDRGIIKTIVKYGYHIQVAFYKRGLSACTGLPLKDLHAVLVFVSVNAPHTVRRVKLTEFFLQKGQKECDKAIALWGEALKTGKWTDPREDEVFEADAPAYMDDEEDEIIIT